MKRWSLVAALAVSALLIAQPAAAGAKENFARAVATILAEPYQPDYVPEGDDRAFEGSVRNTHPAQDYTSGSRDFAGNPDWPGWPFAFKDIGAGGLPPLISADGAPLTGKIALHEGGKRPGVVVVHGFNTNGRDSVVRWAAMLYANGYNVIAANQRNFRQEHAASGNTYWRTWPQTFGWKEAQDVLAAGRYLRATGTVTSVGVVGFSLGGQDTVLALALDKKKVFAAGVNYSGPADQNAQIYSTAFPPGCQPPLCTYPTTSALVAIVVPPYSFTGPCEALTHAATTYGVTRPFILAQESAYREQLKVKVPLLSVYAEDDPLVGSFQASMMAAYDDRATRHTFMLQRGLHAYFNDRWWQQRASLLYFKALLAPKDVRITTEATVNRTPGGRPASEQLVDLGSPTRDWADDQRGPTVCP